MPLPGNPHILYTRHMRDVARPGRTERAALDHVNYVVYVFHVAAPKQNLTVELDMDTIHKAKVLAAKEGTSVSRLVAKTIRRLVDEDELYEAAHRQARTLFEKGFHLGGKIRVSRDEWHRR